MKKFMFSLARMRDYKQQLLDKEKNSLVKLRAERNSLDNRYDSIQHDYDDINMEMSNKIRLSITVSEIKLYQYRKDSIKYEQAQLKKRMSILDKAIEQQLSVVVKMSQEVSGLDKLEDKQREEYNKVVAKAEENTIAEFISMKVAKETMNISVSE